MTSTDLGELSASVSAEQLALVCKEFGVRELAAFGSRSAGTASDDSDLDLLYELDPTTSLGWGIQDLEDRLSELFGLPVDLVSKKYLHRRLRDHILAEATVIYAA